MQSVDADRPIRVLVVDADRRVRQSVCGLIELADGLELAGWAADPAGALETLRSDPVDVVLLDPRLPEFEAGRALAGAIASDWPDIAVVALSWPVDPSTNGLRSITVAPSSIQPDALVDLLRGTRR
jgi:DNA-binding NarL/FixJ family response regulator